MPLVKTGGRSPYEGKVMTTMGYKEPRPPECVKCRQRVKGVLYTRTPNGQDLCGPCAGDSFLVPDEPSES